MLVLFLVFYQLISSKKKLDDKPKTVKNQPKNQSKGLDLDFKQLFENLKNLTSKNHTRNSPLIKKPNKNSHPVVSNHPDSPHDQLHSKLFNESMWFIPLDDEFKAIS